MQENRADRTPGFGAACASIFKMILRKFSTKDNVTYEVSYLAFNSTPFGARMCELRSFW